MHEEIPRKFAALYVIIHLVRGCPRVSLFEIRRVPQEVVNGAALGAATPGILRFAATKHGRQYGEGEEFLEHPGPRATIKNWLLACAYSNQICVKGRATSNVLPMEMLGTMDNSNVDRRMADTYGFVC